MRSLTLPLLLTSVPALAAEVTGYVESRTQYSRSRVRGLLPTDAQPEVQQLLELNAQPRHEYRPGGFVAADLSLFLQGAWRYRGLDEQGQEVGVPVREASAARPFVSLSELYLSHEVVPALHLLAGKKRILWGTGWAYNPTDLLNPPKDPTDPSSQRVGAYMLRVEVPLEKYTFSFVASPAVLEQESGLPRALLVYPEWRSLDREAHYLLAARAYALVANADLNLMLFHSNLYGDDFEDKTRLGFSFSRYFFDVYELHLEALVGRGSARNYPTPGCLDSPEAAVDCFQRGAPLIAQRRLDEQRLRPRILVGTRYQFSDESLLSAEYLYQADGLKRSEFQDVVNGLSLLSVARLRSGTRSARRAAASSRCSPTSCGGRAAVTGSRRCVSGSARGSPRSSSASRSSGSGAGREAGLGAPSPGWIGTLVRCSAHWAGRNGILGRSAAAATLDAGRRSGQMCRRRHKCPGSRPADPT
jgi:hypothetical protein